MAQQTIKSSSTLNLNKALHITRESCKVSRTISKGSAKISNMENFVEGNDPSMHHISLGLYNADHHPTATEAEAMEIFRSFAPSEIAQVYTSRLSNIATISEQIGEIDSHSHRLLSKYDRKAQFSTVEKLPDIVALCDMIRSCNGKALVEKFPDRFRKLIGKEDEPVSEMLYKLVDDQVDIGCQKPIMLGLVAAFTPKNKRGRIAYRDWPGFRTHEFKQIVEHTPDLSHNATPEERLKAVIALLTTNHEDALKMVAQTRGIDLSTLERGSETSRTLHKLAGEYLAANTFYGVLTDRAGTGYGSVFKVHPETHYGPIETARNMCPAAPLTSAYLDGVGHALDANQQTVLAYMNSRSPKPNLLQRIFAR